MLKIFLFSLHHTPNKIQNMLPTLAPWRCLRLRELLEHKQSTQSLTTVVRTVDDVVSCWRFHRWHLERSRVACSRVRPSTNHSPSLEDLGPGKWRLLDFCLRKRPPVFPKIHGWSTMEDSWSFIFFFRKTLQNGCLNMFKRYFCGDKKSPRENSSEKLQARRLFPREVLGKRLGVL